MHSRIAILTGLLAACSATGACTMAADPAAPAAQETAAPAAVAPSQPVGGHVTDLQAFDAFIATRPTAAQFRQQYPDVQLVMPGTVTTKELRTNNSRYFARLDDDGRIVGGRFM